MVQGLKIKHFNCTMPESIQFPLPSQQLAIKSMAFCCELSFNQTQFVNSLVKILRVILFQDAKILSFFACDFFLKCSVLTPKSFLSGVYLPTSFLSGVCFLRLHGEKATTGFNQ